MLILLNAFTRSRWPLSLLGALVVAPACANQSPGAPFTTSAPATGNAASVNEGEAAAGSADGPSTAEVPATSDDAGTEVSGVDGAAGEDTGTDPAYAVTGPPFDAGGGGLCAAPLSPADLMIDELMIESVAGAGDYGEWLEVTSTLDCAVNLQGLHGECPHGAKVATFDVTDDTWVPARGTFVVADSSDPVLNHYLPGTVVNWLGQPGDVLRNKGTTVTLSVAGVVIDTLTYPALTLTVGASLAFPSDCDPTLRADFTRWKTSAASWFPGFRGTPNAPNTDVSCD